MRHDVTMWSPEENILTALNIKRKSSDTLFFSLNVFFSSWVGDVCDERTLTNYIPLYPHQEKKRKMNVQACFFVTASAKLICLITAGRCDCILSFAVLVGCIFQRQNLSLCNSPSACAGLIAQRPSGLTPVAACCIGASLYKGTLGVTLTPCKENVHFECVPLGSPPPPFSE